MAILSKSTNIDGVVSDVNNSASDEEMSASLSEISINMQRANNISKDADGQSIKTMEIMQELQSSAQEIANCRCNKYYSRSNKYTCSKRNN